jgi:hypothetical protein
VNFLEAKTRVYEDGLNRLDRALEGAKGGRGNVERLVADLKQEISDLRHRRATLR